MAKSLLKVEFNDAQMARKLKKLAKAYGDNQEQAVKRWGVQTCRDLAKYTQIFVSKPKFHKDTLFKEALKVIYAHEGSSKSSKTGRSVTFTMQGKRRSASTGDYLRSVPDVLSWIEQNRTGKHRRTVKLPPSRRKYCGITRLRKAINQKYKRTAGMAKDGWLDAGEQISKGQKGSSPNKIGASLMKFARKPAKLGYAREGSRMMKSFGELTNKLPYSSSKHVLSTANKKLAVRDGMNNTLKWYKRAIKAENKKKK